MTWWQDMGLLDAKIAGVEFIVEEITDQLGRRVVAPLLPGRDARPGTIDLGRRAVGWSVSGYISGDYIAAYNRLRKAFNDTPGPYAFSHPYLGEYLVDILDQPELAHSSDRGGWCTLSFRATQASDAMPFSQPVATPNARVRLAAAAAPELLAEGFEKKVPKKGFLDSLALAAAWIGDLADRLDDARARGAALAGAPLALADAIQDLRTSAKQLAGLPGQLARSLGALITSIMSLVSGGGADGGAGTAPSELSPAEARVARRLTIDVLATCATWDPYPPEARTGLPAPKIERIAEAYQGLVAGLALAAACDILRELPLGSAGAAKAVTATILQYGDDIIHRPQVDDATWKAVQDLQHAWAALASAAAAELPEVRTVILAAPRPALLLAWELYGDASRGEDIADNNGVLESNFLPAGVPLEVLAR